MYTFDEAKTLYDSGKYIEAYKAFSNMEETLDVTYYLGLCHFNGNGCKLNFQKAFECFAKLGINKYEEAYYYLGYLYEYGLGVPINFRQAVLWYSYSAEINNYKAMYRLGRIYKNYDLDKSIYYLDLAIKGNNVNAMLLKSELVSDLDTKLELLNNASNLGNKKALIRLTKYYIENNINNPNLKNYLNESIKLGNIETYSLYAKVLFDGILLDKNYSLAIKFLESGASLGCIECKRTLGNCYRDGDYIEKDLYKAINYYEDCAKLNDLEALYNLVDIYYNNPLIKDHEKLALFYLLQIANLGEVNANKYLGIMYEKGIACEVDYALSYKYYSKASLLGDNYSIEALTRFRKNLNGDYKIKEKKC